MSNQVYSKVADSIFGDTKRGYSNLPVNEKLPNTNQIRNNDGSGFAFQVDDWTQLNRMLIIGSSENTFYVNAERLTLDNTKNIVKLIEADGIRVVNEIIRVSQGGLAPKNTPALFALALCAAKGNPAVQDAALFHALPLVARIPTDLFFFVEVLCGNNKDSGLRGWGRKVRRAIANWYNSKEAKDLAYHLVKYRERNGWSHKRLLDLAHPKPIDFAHNGLYNWVEFGSSYLKESVNVIEGNPDFAHVYAYEKAKRATTGKQICELIREYNMPREAVPTNYLNDKEVWAALSEKMPMTALIRNLATLTRLGIIAPLSSGNKRIIEQITNAEYLRKSRIHPMSILVALKTYEQGHGEKGNSTWTPVPQLVDALNDAFYASFGNVTPTGKSTLIGLDVSSSMDSPQISGMTGITPRIASAAMCLVTANVEPNYHILGFSHNLVDVPITPKMRLDEVIKTINKIPFGATNISLPLMWACGIEVELNNYYSSYSSSRTPIKTNKTGPIKEVENFIVLTDNECNGGMHVSEALKKYRRDSGINAKLAVVGMTASSISVADPKDKGTMDFCGMSAEVPNIMTAFFNGEI